MSRAVWIRRLAFAVTVAVALGYVPYHLYASSGLHRYLKLRAERDGLHRSNLELYEENQRLRAELEALAGGDGEGETLSPGAVERAARDELGLVKPGEIVFKVEAPKIEAHQP